MKYIYTFVLFLTIQKASAQNAKNHLVVSTNAILSFSLSTPQDLEQTRTIYNALTISLKARSKKAMVSARLSFVNAPAGVNTNDLIGLQFSSSNSNNYSGVSYNPVYLAATDKVLFYQPKYSKNQYRNFNYHLLMKPVGYEASPGYYSFNILFTMSQP